MLPADPHDPERLSRLWVEQPWRFNLEDHERIKEDGPEPAVPDQEKQSAQAVRSLAFHPVIVGDHAVVADARYVTAYDLRRGTAAVWYDLERVHDIAGLELGLPAKPDLRYTLTVADNCIYARLGAQEIGPRDHEKPDDKKGLSYLVCLQLLPDGSGVRERWWTPPALPNKEGGGVRGCPGRARRTGVYRGDSLRRRPGRHRHPVLPRECPRDSLAPLAAGRLLGAGAARQGRALPAPSADARRCLRGLLLAFGRHRRARRGDRSPCLGRALPAVGRQACRKAARPGSVRLRGRPNLRRPGGRGSAALPRPDDGARPFGNGSGSASFT